MAQSDRIVLYTQEESPFCQRVHIALEEANVQYTPVFIDLQNRPTWFLEKINPIGKIPALAYGGSANAPVQDPPPDCEILTESLPIVLLIADLFPSSGLLPSSPAQRARALRFALTFETRFLSAFRGVFLEGDAAAPARLLAALEAIQTFLPEAERDAAGEPQFAVGQWSIADCAAAPFLVRLVLMVERGPPSANVGALAGLKGPKFARLMRYVEDIKARPSFQKTYNEMRVMMFWKHNPGAIRE